MRLPLIVGFLISSFCTLAQEINIIPKPLKVTQSEKGSFILKRKITVSNLFPNNDKESSNVTKYLADYLKKYYGLEVIVAANGSKADITLFPTRMPTGGSLAYRLLVNSNGIRIEANFDEAAFHGVQSLIQLLPVDSKTALSVPFVTIYDEPRFKYRGMHLDIGRHYQPVAFIKRYIDFLAYHKLNKFHWHLTEDQGWRIEIKQYPELTTIGSKRNGTIIGRYPGKGNDNKLHSGFYTQAQIKEVVQYAKERFVEVIPEIEMPGHSSAAIAAYPWLSCFPEKPTAIPANMISQKSIEEQKNGRIKLVQETWGVFDDVFCAGNDSVFTFLQNVIDEVIPLFPSKYFHIGADECPKTHWKQCPRCQQRMKDLGLKDEHELQSWFVQRIEKYLNSKGKTLIGWDEILEGGLAPNAIVMSWRGEAGGIEAAKQKHQVIMTPGKPVYFDHTQSKNEDSVTIGGYNPIEAVYAYDPVPKELNEEEAKYVLGAQANVWTEYMNNTKKIEYMIFPRMAALSEVLWSKKENKSWDDFEKRLPVQMKRYEMMGLNYSKAYYDLEVSVKELPDSLRNPYVNTIIYYYKSKLKNEPIFFDLQYDDVKRRMPGQITGNEDHQYIFGSCNTVITLKKIDALKNQTLSVVKQRFNFSKSTGKKITLTTPPSNSYPGDGPFTLVNGIINEKGRERAHEILGFSGTDCEAVIDLGKQDTISNVTAHIFSQPSSWIWPPSSFTVQTSMDGINFNAIVDVGPPVLNENKVQLNFPAQITRYIKVFIKNKGIIPEGNPGAGKNAWLFVSEIMVN
ncbi:MAG: beta-N-acetylhexosaminidase [Chitinophagaceae bacterium]|nr:beta-N-acetylhexosaminidase [Chitinophagaceae bacterium]